MKKVLQETLNNYLKASFKTKLKRSLKELQSKNTFSETIEMLNEVAERRDFLEDEFGINMSEYDEKFLDIIESLMKIHYNESQISLINYYVFKIPYLEDYTGKLVIYKGKTASTVPLETPEDLWRAIKLLK